MQVHFLRTTSPTFSAGHSLSASSDLVRPRLTRGNTGKSDLQIVCTNIHRDGALLLKKHSRCNTTFTLSVSSFWKSGYGSHLYRTIRFSRGTSVHTYSVTLFMGEMQMSPS